MEIAQLKEQINILQQNEKDYQDLNFLFTNLEHRYNLLSEEKSRVEIEYNRRHEFNMQAIAMHRAEIDQLRSELLTERQTLDNYKEQSEYLLYENQQLSDEVNNLREAYTKIVEQIQEQDEQYKCSLQAKQQHIDSLAFQVKQMQELKSMQDKKMMSDIEVKHQQSWKVDKYINEIENYKSQNDKLNLENKQFQKQVERLELQIINYKDQMTAMADEIGKLQHCMGQLTRELKEQQLARTTTKELHYEVENKNLKQLNHGLQVKIEHYQQQLDVLMENNKQLLVECDAMRNRMMDLESNKSMVQSQYAKSLSKMQEERKIIKDYLQKQKQLRENRLTNENEVSRCLEEITKYNRNF